MCAWQTHGVGNQHDGCHTILARKRPCYFVGQRQGPWSDRRAHLMARVGTRFGVRRALPAPRVLRAAMLCRVTSTNSGVATWSGATSHAAASGAAELVGMAAVVLVRHITHGGNLDTTLGFASNTPGTSHTLQLPRGLSITKMVLKVAARCVAYPKYCGAKSSMTTRE